MIIYNISLAIQAQAESANKSYPLSPHRALSPLPQSKHSSAHY